MLWYRVTYIYVCVDLVVILNSWVCHSSKLCYLALQVLVLIHATFDVKKQEGHPVAKSGTLSFAANVRLIEAFANACGYALIFIQAVINDFTS